MYEFAVFAARRAFAAGILGSAFTAINVLGISQRKCQFARSFRTEEKLGMAHPVVEHSTFKALFQRLLANDITEFHALRRWKNKGVKIMVFWNVRAGEWEAQSKIYVLLLNHISVSDPCWQQFK